MTREELHITLWMISLGLMVVASVRHSALASVAAGAAAIFGTVLVKKGTSHDS